MELLNLIFWLLVAVLLLVPMAVGVYLLATPTDRIYERWVRIRQAHSHLSLKDEHFRHFPQALSLLRFLSIVIIAGCVMGLYCLITLI